MTPKSSDHNVSSDMAARKIASFFHRKKSSLNNTEKKSSFPKAENYLAPFNPTDKTAIQEVVRLANFQSTDVLYDIGCGDGRVLIEAVRSSKLTSAIGVEYDQNMLRAQAMLCQMLDWMILSKLFMVMHVKLLWTMQQYCLYTWYQKD